jgi:hypothetical protein
MGSLAGTNLDRPIYARYEPLSNPAMAEMGRSHIAQGSSTLLEPDLAGVLPVCHSRVGPTNMDTSGGAQHHRAHSNKASRPWVNSDSGGTTLQTSPWIAWACAGDRLGSRGKCKRRATATG